MTLTANYAKHANEKVVRGFRLFRGSLQGAGGVGGVLFIGHFASAIGHHAVAYDGNGNVTALLNAATGEESARYEYGPFAEGIRMTGPLAKLNLIRFSTQYADDVTGDTKYLFRDYQAETGRWPNRDPLGERGGKNLYCFVNNRPINAVDALGLVDATFGPPTISDTGAGGFHTEFPPRITFRCLPCGLNGRGILFTYRQGVDTILPPETSDIWRKSNLYFLDQEVNEAWINDSSYQGRRAAIIRHEQKHIDDMKSAYDQVVRILEAVEIHSYFSSPLECFRTGNDYVRRMYALLVKAGTDSQNKWD